jgi:hypothetical protein
MASERLIWETAKSSRHFFMVEPGLLERIISPAILLAKTSLRPGDTDIKYFLSTCTPPSKLRYKTIALFPRTKQKTKGLPLKKKGVKLAIKHGFALLTLELALTHMSDY